MQKTGNHFSEEDCKMTQLELNDDQTALLIEILQSSLSDLKTERVRTDRRELHAQFLVRENFVADLINRLEGKQ